MAAVPGVDQATDIRNPGWTVQSWYFFKTLSILILASGLLYKRVKMEKKEGI